MFRHRLNSIEPPWYVTRMPGGGKMAGHEDDHTDAAAFMTTSQNADDLAYSGGVLKRLDELSERVTDSVLVTIATEARLHFEPSVGCLIPEAANARKPGAAMMQKFWQPKTMKRLWPLRQKISSARGGQGRRDQRCACGMDRTADSVADSACMTKAVLESPPGRVTDTIIHNPYRNVGRNDPCPCGSGKKFKKCCLDKVR